MMKLSKILKSNTFSNIIIYLSLLSTSFSSNLVDNDTNSFITNEEYGKMLYSNPRGIGCHKCHGLTGLGHFIASYKNKIKHSKKLVEVKLYAPSIINVPFVKFKKKINSTKPKSIMPQYFLTNEELETIYTYLTTQNDQDE